jgi:hypothetical protein
LPSANPTREFYSADTVERDDGWKDNESGNARNGNVGGFVDQISGQIQEHVMSEGVDQANDNLQSANENISGGTGEGGTVSGSAAGAVGAASGSELNQQQSASDAQDEGDSDESAIGNDWPTSQQAGQNMDEDDDDLGDSGSAASAAGPAI